MYTVQGGSLSALLKRAREYDEILNEFEVADWLIHITLALQHLHSKYECICNCSLSLCVLTMTVIAVKVFSV